MRLMIRCLIPLLGWSTGLLAEPLVWGYSPSDPPPYVEMTGAELDNSVTRDLGELVAANLGRRLSFVAVPNNRIEDALKSGRIHMICNTQPQWHSQPELLHWSAVLYEDADVLATPASQPAPQTLASLQGALVGTTIGYHYSSELTRAFERGDLVRRDVRNIETRLKMLERGRLDASIDLRRALSYQLHKHPADIRVSDWPLELFALRCAAPKTTAGSADLVEAIDKLLALGQIQQILNRYQ